MFHGIFETLVVPTKLQYLSNHCDIRNIPTKNLRYVTLQAIVRTLTLSEVGSQNILTKE